MKNPVYKCKACGMEFNGGRRLGDHYAAYPEHRPGTRPKGGRGGPSIRTSWRKLSTTDLIQAAIDKLAVEINAKRQLLADVERLKVEITTMENQRTELQKMLPAATA